MTPLSSLSSPRALLLAILLFALAANAQRTRNNSEAITSSSSDPPNGKLKILITAISISYSHVQFQGRIADVLAQEGHYVHYLIHELRPVAQNCTEHSHKVTRIKSHEVSDRENQEKDKAMNAIFDNTTAYNPTSLFAMGKSIGAVCAESFTNAELHAMLKNENFDIGISEEYDICGFTLFKLLGIKAIVSVAPGALSDEHEEQLGIPIERSYNNLNFNGYMNAPYFTLWQRIVGTMENILYRKPLAYAGDGVVSTLKTIMGPDFELATVQDVCYFFTNTHEFIDIPRPTTPKVIPIGGIALNDPGSLNPEVAKIMEDSIAGVVLFTWGQQVEISTIPRYLKLNIFNAFAHFPEYTFLVRYKRDGVSEPDVIDNYPNIYAFGWLPQSGILAHPKIRAFVTHGGRNGMMEAIYSGVPTISVPLFADQHHSAATYQYRKVGIAVDLRDLTEDNLVRALNGVLNNPEYMKNAQELKERLAAVPFSPRERFVKHIDFIGKFKHTSDLGLPGEHLPYIIRRNFDAVAIIVVASLIVAFIVSRIITGVVEGVVGRSKAS